MRRNLSSFRARAVWPLPMAAPPSLESGTALELRQLLVPMVAVPLAAILIGGVSLATGTSRDYVLLQVVSLLLLLPLVIIIRRIDACTGSIVLASFMKLFWLSQVAVIFFWRPADLSLQQPLTTAAAITIGAVAAIAGILAASALLRSLPPVRPLLALGRQSELSTVGIGAAVAGLAAQGIWGFLSSSMSTASSLNLGALASGLVVLSYFAPLAMLSICCFAADTLIATDGRKLISRRVAIVLLIYMIEVAPLGVKTAPLKPIIALAATALAFGWRPTPAPLIGGLALILFVAGFLYPVVNVARLRSMEQRRVLPLVLIEVAGTALADPGYFATIKAKSESYEREIGQAYFGRPVGFLDRFTPLTTDRLIAASTIAPAEGTRAYLAEAGSGLLPRTFGFERDMTRRQAELEAAMTRRHMENGKVGWDNTGFVADAYYSGGVTTVAATLFMFALIIGLLSRLTFGSGRGSVIWIPFFVEFMFAPADVTLSAVVPSLMWLWVFLTGSIWMLLRAARAPSPKRVRR